MSTLAFCVLSPESHSHAIWPSDEKRKDPNVKLKIAKRKMPFLSCESFSGSLNKRFFVAIARISVLLIRSLYSLRSCRGANPIF